MVHHDVTDYDFNFDALDIAWDEQLHSFVEDMAEGNMFSDLYTRFDYNQNASERQFR